MAPRALNETFISLSFVPTKIKLLNNERADADFPAPTRQPLVFQIMANSFSKSQRERANIFALARVWERRQPNLKTSNASFNFKKMIFGLGAGWQKSFFEGEMF